MGLGIPPLRIQIMLESNPLKSTMLVGRLGVLGCGQMRSTLISNGAPAKVMGCDRLGKKVRPGTFGKIKVG